MRGGLRGPFSDSDAWCASASERGKVLFREIGCAVCHTPDMAGVEGVYSDFLLHRLDDRSRSGGAGGYRETPPVPLPEDYPLPEEWKTPPSGEWRIPPRICTTATPRPWSRRSGGIMAMPNP
jgi:hypothetical protein